MDAISFCKGIRSSRDFLELHVKMHETNLLVGVHGSKPARTSLSALGGDFGNFLRRF